MLHFVAGHRQSGKSLYAEHLIGSFGTRVTYVGTLPRHPIYEEAISVHQRRRPADWGLLELIGQPRADMASLYEALASSDALLIDGISFYLFRLHGFGLGLKELRRHASLLLSRLCDAPCEVVIVDNPVPRGLSLAVRRTLRYAHVLLLRSAATVTFVSSGSAVPVSRRWLLALDPKGEEE